MNKIIIATFLFIQSWILNAQAIDDFLEKVYLNNPDIEAASLLMSADEAFSKTGLNPDDPVLRGGYFPGSPATNNDKFTWGISQSFDFPSRYSKLKELRRTNLEQARNEYALLKMELMENARSLALEYISMQKQLARLEERKNNLFQMEQSYLKMFESGETTIIEVNKIRIWRTRIESEIRELVTKKALSASGLDYLSGGNSALLDKSEFPVFGSIGIDSLINIYYNVHPAFRLPSFENKASMDMVELARSENLPSFELGYSSEIVGTERFTGPSLGISLPLWKNSGKVKSTIAQSEYIRQKNLNTLALLETEYRNYYSSLLSVSDNIEMLNNALSDSNNRMLLNKLLDEGEIALAEYYLELSAIYELEDIYIELMLKKNTLLSKLFEIDFND